MSLETIASLNDDPIVKLPAMADGVLSVSRISLPWLSDRSRLPDQAGFVLPRFPACTSRLVTGDVALYDRLTGWRVPQSGGGSQPSPRDSMTSPNRYRHIPLRRLLRDSLKRLYLAIYKLGIRLGVHILPAHYYAPVPNIIELERTVDLWAKPSAMSGVHIDLDEQIDNLRRVCAISTGVPW